MIDTAEFSKKLNSEKERVLIDLKSLGGYENPESAGDWEVKMDDSTSTSSDENEVADVIEEMTTNSGVVNQLEVRLREINDALIKIENGTYGICETSGEMIPIERLRVNPAARTMVEHEEE